MGGGSCMFQHLSGDVGGSIAPFGSGANSHSGIPCRYFPLGLCFKGNLCTFSHEEAASAAPVPLAEKFEEECAYFKRGHCTRGASCQWAHGALELFEVSL